MPSEAGAAPAGQLAVHDLQVTYGRRAPPVHVLRGLELVAVPGQIVAVMGASGSGKSTLLHVLGGMLRPQSGQVELSGTDPWRLGPDARASWRNSNVGFVFQAHRLLGELNALENVLSPTWIAGVPAAPAREAAEGLLERLGLAGRLHHFPAELSGGEAQRVAIARALVRAPGLVLADEPTGNLDGHAGERVFEEFLALQRQRRFILLLATHDVRLARRCDRVLRLVEGRLQPADLE